MIPGLWGRPETPLGLRPLSELGCGLFGPTVICFEVGFMVRLRGLTHGSEEEGQ